jgi:hypothetical protein
MKILNSLIRKMLAASILIFIGITVSAQNADELVAQDETKADVLANTTDAVSESETLESNFLNL